jgi:hypothetical protein
LNWYSGQARGVNDAARKRRQRCEPAWSTPELVLTR